MRVAIIGAPGSDSEVYAERAAARLGVPVIRFRDVVQAETRAGTPAAVEAARHMNAGHLVPQSVMTTMLRDRLARPDTARGLVFDNIPSPSIQPAAVDELVALDVVADLRLTDAEVMRRLSDRRMCDGCGRVGSADGTCACGGTFIRRPDDRPDEIALKLESYRRSIAPVLAHYRAAGRLRTIDATGTADEILAGVLR